MYEVEIKLLNGSIQKCVTDGYGIGELLKNNIYIIIIILKYFVRYGTKNIRKANVEL